MSGGGGRSAHMSDDEYADYVLWKREKRQIQEYKSKPRNWFDSVKYILCLDWLSCRNIVRIILWTFFFLWFWNQVLMYLGIIPSNQEIIRRTSPTVPQTCSM
jgi:hypothetical protein